MSELSERMRPRVRPGAAKPAADAFRADQMRRVTLYLPAGVLRRLKQAALDGDTSVSRIITGLAEDWLNKQT